jgi:hypothetical protein
MSIAAVMMVVRNDLNNGGGATGFVDGDVMDCGWIYIATRVRDTFADSCDGYSDDVNRNLVRIPFWEGVAQSPKSTQAISLSAGPPAKPAREVCRHDGRNTTLTKIQIKGSRLSKNAS